MKPRTITTKQKTILELLYKYRYLDRIQIQKALKHKDKRRIQAWLKDLREKQYVEWIYSTDFIEKTKPAIYYLGINGIRYLKALDQYPNEEIRKRYKDKNRSRTFVDRSLLIAACGLELASSLNFRFITEADYIDPAHHHNFLAEEDIIRPSLVIQKHVNNVFTNYLLEVLDASLPRYRVRRRLKAYVTYLDDALWPYDSELSVLIVLPYTTELIYAKRATKKLIADTYAEPETLQISFTTTDTLKRDGVLAKIWEAGQSRHSL
ncbi:MAG: hypothetical protein NVS1B7_1610 [Candidatus Saccharimonadales bacterium]